MESLFSSFTAELNAAAPVTPMGHVRAVEGTLIQVSAPNCDARIGDRLCLTRRDLPPLDGEVIAIHEEYFSMLAEGSMDGVARGDGVTIRRDEGLAPSESWIGRVIDPLGRPLDGRPLLRGGAGRALRGSAPKAVARKPFGPRLETGKTIFNTILPIVQGQRIGLFAGSGVGKSTLLGDFAKSMTADLVVIALVGERGREVREFVEETLGAEGLARAVVVAATSDQSPLMRRRCAWSAMTVAEHFRDQGLHVLLLTDSVTRFAEAHREIATAAGELPALRGFPPSMAHMVMSLCERAGPGPRDVGDITAIFTVLVAGSDMDEPVADVLRGVLDGHVVLERAIAERGRFPAVNPLKSVSRSLPQAASPYENKLIQTVRKLIGDYEQAEMMIRSGLYVTGSDEAIDKAAAIRPALEDYMSESEPNTCAQSFTRLELVLRRNGISLPEKASTESA